MKRIIPLLLAFALIFGISQSAITETSGQTRQVIYYMEANALYNKVSQLSLHRSYLDEIVATLLGVSDYKKLPDKHLDLMFQLKPTTTSVATKKVKVTVSQIYKKTKMWGDYVEAWYVTDTKYELVPLSAK